MEVFHEFIDGQKTPRIVVIPSIYINWTETVNHFPLPDIRFSEDMNEMDELAVNLTVFSDELIQVPDEKYFGIDTYRIKNRIVEQGIDPQDINNLVIRLVDLDEIFEMTY